MLSEILFLMKKDKKPQKINLVVNLLELIQVMQKNGYDLDCEVGNIEYLLMSLKIKKQKNQKKKLIKKKEMREKVVKEMREKVEKEREDKNKKSTTNQITNNFKLIIIRNS